jgi:2-dehydro-3-deoxyphosphogalactonate aldolase
VNLAKGLGDRVLVGAGTVTDREQVTKIADAGGKVIVMPHADERVVEAAKRRNLFVVPGFATPTEAFRMINAGADAIVVSAKPIRRKC